MAGDKQTRDPIKLDEVARPAVVARVPLVETKFVPPRPAAGQIALEARHDWLTRVPMQMLTIVRAPPGYGKTTLCAAWHRRLSADRYRTGWISLDDDDDDAARFIQCLKKALRPISWRDEPVLDTTVAPETAAAQILNAIHDFGEPFALFLDEADRLKNPRALKLVAYLLAHAPDNLRVVMTCRSLPGIALASLDHSGALARIDTSALRLSDEEAAALIAAQGSPVPPGQIGALNAAMAGWPIGLRALALADGKESRTADRLREYFEEWTTQQIAPRTLEMLTQCAVTDVLTASLCQVLTSDPTAGAAIVQLADRNAFVEHDLDGGLRIHPAFRAFLLRRLAASNDAAVAGQHLKASRWLEGSGQSAAAIDHAFQANAFALAAELIATAAPGMLERSEVETLLQWIERLPASALAAHASLHVARAWALTLCIRTEAKGALAELRGIAASAADSTANAALGNEAAAIQTVQCVLLDDRLDQAEQQARAFLNAPHDDTSFGARAVRNSAAYCAIHRGEHDEVHDLLRPAQLHALHAEQIFPTAYRYAVTGLGFRMQGQLGEAERTFKAGLEITERAAGPRSASAALTAAFLARSLYERDEAASAAQLLHDDRLATIDAACFIEAALAAYPVRIRLAARAGRLAEAATLIERAELIGHSRGWRRLIAACIVERARLGLPPTISPDALLAAADEDRAIADPLSPEAGIFAILAEKRIYEAVSAYNRPRLNEVSDRMEQLATRANSLELRMKAALYQLIPQLSGRCDKVVDMEQVKLLNLAAQRGYHRTILDALDVVGVGAMTQLDNASYAPDTFLALIERAGIGRPEAGRDTELTRSSQALSILTAREIDILAAVGNGDSNKEIARRLNLTPETIKWHLKNAMRKLGAMSRAEAVACASTLGLTLTPNG